MMHPSRERAVRERGAEGPHGSGVGFVVIVTRYLGEKGVGEEVRRGKDGHGS